MLTILCGDALEQLRGLPDESVQCCVTSPPYWGLRDYGTAKWYGGEPACDHKQGRPGAGRADGIVDERSQRNRDGVGSMGGDCAKCGAKRIDSQLGLEKTPEEYVAKMVAVFQEVRRVLRSDGTLWLNIGDSYATGAGAVGNCPGGGKQGDAWKGHRGSRGGSSKQPHTGSAIGPLTQPNRMPLPGLKPKDLVGIPWATAFALRADGWYLRQDIIWSKPNPMPESVTDRCTKAHEYLFLLTKSARYYYDAEAIAEASSLAMLDQMNDGYEGEGLKDYQGNGVQNPSSVKARIIANARKKHRKHRLPAGWDTSSGGGGHGAIHREGRAPSVEYLDVNSVRRNKRSVWTVTTAPFHDAHFATYPPDLIKPCILAGSKPGDTILDPFAGSGTTGMVAIELGRKATLIELNPEYVKLIKRRCDVTPGLALT